MRVIHFTAAGDTINDLNYLAIQRREDDSDIRIPVYRKEADGVYHQTPVFFSLMHEIHVSRGREG